MSSEKEVCVVTGGGSGMGLAAAMNMPLNKIIVISGRTVNKLEKAQAQLRENGHIVYTHACDVSKRQSVQNLAYYAAGLGEVKNVINCAGVSPAMADAESLVRTNALGTVYINEEFGRVMHEGSVIVDVSSSAAYTIPNGVRPICRFRSAVKNEDAFLKRVVHLTSLLPSDYMKSGFAYAISKNFVCWYAQYSSYELGKRKIRVVSLSPGLVATDMGELEKENGEVMIQTTAEHRMGTADELGFAIASLADERNGYLTGVDVLCDGGSTKLQKQNRSTHEIMHIANARNGSLN